MKIDRLLEIIIHLLNNNNVSAKKLADYFDISVRTIQRDMTSISLAGIPIYNCGGKNGGYSIMSEYTISSQNMKTEDYQLILKSLKSLATSYSNKTLDGLIAKLSTLAKNNNGQSIFWDFGVTKENSEVQKLNDALQKAIKEKNIVKFKYRSANGNESERKVQPLAIHYKWYAWYLFCWSMDSKEYKTCKVARIKSLQITDETSVVSHGDVETLMKESENDYYKTCIKIEIHFYENSIGLMEEYFPDCKIEQVNLNEYMLILNVPQKERLWKALLLSFGKNVWVVSPEEYKEELIETAKDFVSNYDI